MPNDATVHMPPPEPSDPIKQAVYQCRGEAVSIGGTLDYIVRRLTDEFVGTGDPRASTARSWKALKVYINDRGLTDALQPQLAAVAHYFRTRQLAVHGATMIAHVSESTQIFRMYFDGPDHKMEIVTLEDLWREVAVIRAGYEALQAVGRALDNDRPEVLRDWNELPKAMVLGCM